MYLWLWITSQNGQRHMQSLTRAPLPQKKKLVYEIFSWFGVPEELHSGQRRNFEAKVFKEVCQQVGIRKTCTTPFHLQSKGLVEHFNGTLATQLAILMEQKQ